MATIPGKKISEEAAITTLGGSDWMLVSRSVGPTNKKISADNLKVDMTGTKSTTIVAGEITVIESEPVMLISVDTEGAAASDNLDTVTCSRTGKLITLQAADSTHTIVIRDNAIGAGNIYTAGAASFSLDHARDKWLGVVTAAGDIEEISRSNNA